MSDWANMGIGGGSGLVGVVLGWLGFKSKLDSMAKNMRYKDTCDALHKAIDNRLGGIEDMQKEMRDDIKILLPKVK